MNGIELSNNNNNNKTFNTMNPPQDNREPDPDAIKMFVGQVPRSMDENDLRKMFEEYGEVYQLSVLRDKVSGQSKGCCFVTFYTRDAAMDAQRVLHNLKTLGGMQHPVQMKPADSEKRNVEERKLFVGMVSKKCTENDMKVLFAPFGQIEECTILRENGVSKGCAFVTYSNRQSAQNAMKAMHHSQTMEGCRSPVVVKIADTQKDKEMKKIHQLNNNLLTQGLNNVPGLSTIYPQYLTLLQQANGGASGNNSAINQLGLLGNLGLNTLALQQLLAAASSVSAGGNAGLANLAALNAAIQNLTNGTSSSSNGNSRQNINSNSAPSCTSPPPSSPLVTDWCYPSIQHQVDLNNLQNLQNLQGLAVLANLASNPNTLNAVNSVQNLQALNQLASVGSISSPMQGITTSGTSTSIPTTSTGSISSPTNSTASLNGAAAMSVSTSNLTNLSGMSTSSVNGLCNGSLSSNTASNMEALYSGIQQYAGLSTLLPQATFPNAHALSAQMQQQKTIAETPAGKQTEGPEGANLFIYHLPQEFTDQDLFQTFMPFGNVVSAKVFIDKLTKLSKCFGFVSYDNPVSALAAIQNMNGFQIMMKRLKVQLKRPKNESKPY